MRGSLMNIPVRIGMDTSKSVFQLHGVDENEVVVVRRQFRRAEMIHYFERLPPVLVAIESCGSSHHWARLLQSFGHEVKLRVGHIGKRTGVPPHARQCGWCCGFFPGCDPGQQTHGTGESFEDARAGFEKAWQQLSA